MTSETVLEIRNVSKHFGAVKALTAVDFRLARAKFTRFAARTAPASRH